MMLVIRLMGSPEVSHLIRLSCCVRPPPGCIGAGTREAQKSDYAAAWRGSPLYQRCLEDL
jgi:hypothetical protein